jgi:hypothetical protein
MKKKRFSRWRIVGLILGMVMLFSSTGYGENIDPLNDDSQYAYGENVGWLNFEPTEGPGVTVTNTDMTGYLWAENIGWINVSPSTYGGVTNDGYGKNTGSCATVDYGVIIDENGDVEGYAWGENIGWVSFSSAFHQLTMGHCGDGIMQWHAGEECELGVGNECGGNAACIDCLCVPTGPPPLCGDGIVQWHQGEECELGVGKECGPYGECIDCVCESYCGDGTIQWKRGEECELFPGLNRCGPGRVCDPDSCQCVRDPGPIQACCDPDAICLDLTVSECDTQGGIPQGLGTDCEDVTCHLPPEACCSPSGFCIDMALDICLDFSGAPLGVGTNCDTVTCP